jgi:hypothetical protein
MGLRETRGWKESAASLVVEDWRIRSLAGLETLERGRDRTTRRTRREDSENGGFKLDDTTEYARPNADI